LEGVDSVEMDYEEKLFTLKVPAKNGIAPAAIHEALPKRFKVASLRYDSIEGVVRSEEDGLYFRSTAGVEFELRKADGEAWKTLNGIKAGLPVRLSGWGLYETREDEEGKEFQVNMLGVTSAEEVKE